MTPAINSSVSRFLWRALRSRFRDHGAELSAIRRHVRPTDVVCDIGANKGSFLYWMSRWSGRVVAFEPQQDLAVYLSEMCKSLSLDNVLIEPRAVYSESGTRELFIPTGHKPGASLKEVIIPFVEVETVKVSTVSLDDYFSETERVSVLKVDVEGAELDVFKGAQRILRKDMPLLVFECESRHLDAGSIHDIFAGLEKLGYRGSFIDRGHVRPVSAFREEVHQRQDGKWFWKRPGYCHNFVFSPK